MPFGDPQGVRTVESHGAGHAQWSKELATKPGLHNMLVVSQKDLLVVQGQAHAKWLWRNENPSTCIITQTQ